MIMLTDDLRPIQPNLSDLGRPIKIIRSEFLEDESRIIDPSTMRVIKIATKWGSDGRP